MAMVLAASLSADALTLESAPFRVHVSEGGQVLARETLDILLQGLARYDSRLKAGEEPIDVYIARTRAEFIALGAPASMGRVEGFARSRQGEIVIKAPHLMRPDASYSSIVRHELLHILVARNSAPGNMPRWLNEGIAMMVSGEYRWSSMYRVARMYGGGRVIDYAALEYAFAAPGSEEEFGDAYAQSLSMTKYLREELGDERFWEFVRSLKSEPFEEALGFRLGLNQTQFFSQWKSSLWSIAVVSSLISGFGIFQFAAVLAVIAYLRKRRRGKKLMDTWQREDDEEDEIIFPWQLEDQEGPHPWEEDSDD